MKPVLEYLPPGTRKPFLPKHLTFLILALPGHYHPQYGLVLVLKSTGQRTVGDHKELLSDGDSLTHPSSLKNDQFSCP